jgi:hypothetical protein
VRSQEKTWPSSTSAWFAAKRSTSLARPTSYIESFMQSPDSSVIKRAISSWRLAMSSPARMRIL